MNLDDLIQLLLFFVFIVVPLLSRVGRRRGQGGPKPGAPQPGTKQTGTKQTTRTPQARGGASQQMRPRPVQPGPASGGDEFSKRLEEARRRVREAVEGQSAQGRQTEAMGQESASDLFRPSQAPSPNLPSDRDLLGPRTASTSGETVTRGLMGQGTIGSTSTDRSPRPGAFAPGQQQTFATLGDGKKGAITKPLQVQRSLSAKRAKLRGPLLQFGEDDLMRGIVWKQILDEPRAKESWRQQSQRR